MILFSSSSHPTLSPSSRSRPLLFLSPPACCTQPPTSPRSVFYTCHVPLSHVTRVFGHAEVNLAPRCRFLQRQRERWRAKRGGTGLTEGKRGHLRAGGGSNGALRVQFQNNVSVSENMTKRSFVSPLPRTSVIPQSIVLFFFPLPYFSWRRPHEHVRISKNPLDLFHISIR